jgi:hypothetical protein
MISASDRFRVSNTTIPGSQTGPRLVGKLRGEKDSASAAIVQLICDEEERHVRHGMKWFTWLCARDGKDPVTEFHRYSGMGLLVGTGIVGMFLNRPLNLGRKCASLI